MKKGVVVTECGAKQVAAVPWNEIKSFIQGNMSFSKSIALGTNKGHWKTWCKLNSIFLFSIDVCAEYHYAKIKEEKLFFKFLPQEL